MLLRLTPGFGGDGTVCGIIAMDDTGSDMLTLFTTDMLHLGNIQGYAGWLAPTGVRDASGQQILIILAALFLTLPPFQMCNAAAVSNVEQFLVYQDGLARPSHFAVSGYKRHDGLGMENASHYMPRDPE